MDGKELDILAKQEFESDTPGIFLECESGVFVVGGDNSLCYTTSQERADLLVAILNDWARLRRSE